MNATEIMIEILTRASDEGLPEQIGPEDTLDRIAIYAELVDAGCLTGVVSVGQGGRPENVCGARITTVGREYLAQLKKERDDKKALPVAKRKLQWLLLCVVLPIALALVIAWLTRKFGLK